MDLSPLKDGSIWHSSQKPLLARWTSDFDCGHETNWWYCIKDTPFDISILKSKRRYEINKGIKNFYVKRINPSEYAEEIFNINSEAYKNYPSKYRPTMDKHKFIYNMKNTAIPDNIITYGAFCCENDMLCAYNYIVKRGKLIDLPVHKAIPSYEKLGVNAALMYYVLQDIDEDLKCGCYICDGERNISHETKFQDYLEKYFMFRKAYCKMNIRYRTSVAWLVKMSYPIRKIFKAFDFVGIIHNLNSLLNMESLSRSK